MTAIITFGVVGAFCLLFTSGYAAMNAVARIPAVNKKLNDLYQTLPMSRKDWR